MRQQIEQSLRAVPFITTLGITVEEARPGRVMLRLPCAAGNTNAAGDLHSGALFTLGELTASLAVATHPDLGQLLIRQKVAHVQYLETCSMDVTASLRITVDMVATVEIGIGEPEGARLEVPVKVLDGKGRDVAVITTVFGFKRG